MELDPKVHMRYDVTSYNILQALVVYAARCGAKLSGHIT